MQPDELELLVSRHVPGSGKADIRLLERGLVNETYRVLRGERAYALRLAAADAPDLGVDRLWESRVLASAGLAGIAPAIEYCDPARAILITRWAQGTPWTAADARRPANVSRMAALLRRVHALPQPQPQRLVTPAMWIERYSVPPGGESPGAVDGCKATALRGAAALRLASLAALPSAAPTVCHSDLHLLNLIDRGSDLVLLDWEYAHVSDSLWDLAGWSANNDLAEDLWCALLTDYLAREPTDDERARLRLLRWLYDYVCWLWSGLYLRLARRRAAGGPEGSHAAVADRARLLAGRLCAS